MLHNRYQTLQHNDSLNICLKFNGVYAEFYTELFMTHVICVVLDTAWSFSKTEFFSPKLLGLQTMNNMFAFLYLLRNHYANYCFLRWGQDRTPKFSGIYFRDYDAYSYTVFGRCWLLYIWTVHMVSHWIPCQMLIRNPYKDC